MTAALHPGTLSCASTPSFRLTRAPWADSPAASPPHNNTLSSSAPNSPTEHEASSTRRKKKKPYGRRTWLEQKAVQDEESRKAELSQVKEAKRLQRLPKNGADLSQYRPSAPRNTTQFLIDSKHADDGAHNGSSNNNGNENDDRADHGSMFGFRNELAALKLEVIGVRKRGSPAPPRSPPVGAPPRSSSRASRSGSGAGGAASPGAVFM